MAAAKNENPTTPSIGRSAAYEFRLPSGENLVWALPFEKGSFDSWSKTEITRSYQWPRPITPHMSPDERDKIKRLHPKLRFWSENRSLQVICADFDRVPEMFMQAEIGGGKEGYFRYIQHLCGQSGLVLRSVGGNFKVLFVVKMPDATTKMTKSIAEATLRLLLPDELASEADTKGGALLWTYFNQEMCEAISNNLPHCPVHEALIEPPGIHPRTDNESDSIPRQNIENAQPQKHQFWVYKGAIPDSLIEFVYGNDSRAREQFLRRLIPMKSLTTEKGFGLPISKFVSEIFGITSEDKNWENRVRQVLEWRAELQNKFKWIVLSEPASNHENRRANQYTASGSLAQAISAHQQSGSQPLPSLLEDGTWYEWSLILARKSGSLEERLERFKMWPGWDERDRLNRFIGMVKSWDVKKQKLS